MRSIAISILFVLIMLGVAALYHPEPDPSMSVIKKSQTSQPPALAAARQIIVVTTPAWDKIDGRLQRYERAADGQNWQPVGAPIPIVVGRGGMGWGRGIHGAPPGAGPIKREGDGRAPAGLFRLSAAYGYASPDEASRVKLPYVQSLATNDWKSSEQMRRNDELYRWVVVVDHNANTAEAGAGSCIFLHIWSGASQGTAGCTAMEATRMEEVIYWIDPAAHPLLVQMPEAEYAKLREVWKLPVQEGK
jgi:L,D-peptidoglycan transpeptidase YkuD (ErfK/YbiS/YcfS/YnhG family)